MKKLLLLLLLVPSFAHAQVGQPIPFLRWTNATGTNATTTALFSTTASTTNLFIATGNCSGASGNALGVSLGKVGCNAVVASAASSTLYSDNGNFTGVNTFGNVTFTNATSTTLFSTTASSSNLFLSFPSSLLLTSSLGKIGAYAGTSCTNQFVRSLTALGAAGCATVGAADVSLANLTATDATLTFSGTYNGSTARTIGLNLSNANTWGALQTLGSGFISNSSSTQIGNFTIATSSVLSVNTICLSADTCKTAWPTAGSSASSTLYADNGNFTGTNTFTGNTTLGNATATNFFSTTASSSNLFTANFQGANLGACTGNSQGLHWTGGLFSCATLSGFASSTLLGDTNNFTGTNTFAKITFTNATGTTLSLSSASTSSLWIDSTGGGGTTCLQADSTGKVSGTGSACGAGGGGSPGGTGTELQFRGGASTFSAVTGSGVSGGSIGIGTTTPPSRLTIATSTTYTAAFPDLLIGPSGLSSGNANGTLIGANVDSGYSGDAIKIQIAGASRFTVTGTGATTINNPSGVSLTTSGDISSGGAVTAATNVSAGSSNVFQWTSSSRMFAPSDGVIRLSNAANSGFTRLQFGGTTSSFPGISRVSQGLVFGLADGTNGGYFGIGTSTPQWTLQIASSTRPQLALSDGSLTSDHWTFRNTGGTLYLATSSPSTFATSTTEALAISSASTTIYSGSRAINFPAAPGILPIVVAQSGRASSVTSSVSEVNLAVATMTPNIMGANGRLNVDVQYKYTGTTNTKRLVVRFSATPSDTSTGVLLKNRTDSATVLSDWINNVTVYNTNSTGAQVVHDPTASLGGGSTQAVTTGAIDTTGTTYINFNCFVTSASDSCQVLAYTVTLYPSP